MSVPVIKTPNATALNSSQCLSCGTSVIIETSPDTAAHSMPKLILFNKPFGVLTQFTDADGRASLADYIDIPKVYPAGRLDRDSEGLLLLTNDGKLQHQLANPQKKTWKTYWVQIEGTPTTEALLQLEKGVELKDGLTRPAKVKTISPPELWPRDPPIRHREKIPTQWLEICIREGKNRQVRRMTASVGLPTLRLVRVAIGSWQLQQLQPGEWAELNVPAIKASRPKTNPRRRGK